MNKPDTPTTQQSFLNGRITLINGDCQALLRQGALDKADAILTDPPYGIGFQHGGGGNGFSAKIHTDKIIGDDQPFAPAPWLAFAGRGMDQLPLAFFGMENFLSDLPAGTILCWDKSLGLGSTACFTDAEYIWTNRKNARCIYRHYWKGCSRQGMSLNAPRVHVSQKPIELMMWLIETCRIGLDKTILDPYMGSGTTGIAALLSGRRFIGVEVSPQIFADACARLQRAVAYIQDKQEDAAK
jgi:site-specific DNA-methyltransferase (adenine-specific)/modification methylase